MANPEVAIQLTESDQRILDATKRPGESVTDVIRRALRLLGREEACERPRGRALLLPEENSSS